MLLAVLLLTRLSAWTWTLELAPDYSFPPLFLAIDKSLQQLYILEQRSPLKISSELSCSTGKVQGDKFKQGDLRTPEGIYFIEHKRTNALNFNLYGNMAFPLNYPNPVDRIRGKTGDGIWIHGRGTPLTPRETKGCIALNNADINYLDSGLALVKTPVIIGSNVQWTEDDISQADVSLNLKNQVKAWSKAWQNRSDKFFSFYYPDKFTLSEGKQFSEFRQHKMDLFQRYPWIQIYINKIYVLPGPGYWVTYFEQYFRSPDFSSEGLKRLYWQKHEDNFKIVGSEWRAGSWNIKADYTRYIKKDIQNWMTSWKNAWEKADLQNYLNFYDLGAHQDARKGKSSIEKYKRKVWKKERPAKIDLDNIKIVLDPRGVKVVFDQEYTGENGYQDRGNKTMILKPFKQTWRIVKETWSSG